MVLHAEQITLTSVYKKRLLFPITHQRNRARQGQTGNKHIHLMFSGWSSCRFGAAKTWIAREAQQRHLPHLAALSALPAPPPHTAATGTATTRRGTRSNCWSATCEQRLQTMHCTWRRNWRSWGTASIWYVNDWSHAASSLHLWFGWCKGKS